MSHTKGKLKLDRYNNVKTVGGDRLLLSGIAMSTGYDPNQIGESNARRLVACWNACDGISTEGVEFLCSQPNGVAKLALYLKKALEEREKQELPYMGATISESDQPYWSKA